MMLVVAVMGGLLALGTSQEIGILFTVTAAILIAGAVLIERNRSGETPSAKKALLPAQRQALLALYMLWASSMTWRTRTTGAIAANPLDAGGSLRVLLLAVTALAAVLALQRSGISHITELRNRAAVYAFSGYALVGLLGVPSSSNPAYTLFKVGEVCLSLLVFAALATAFHSSVADIFKHHVVLVSLAVSGIIASVLLAPTRAVAAVDGSLVPYQIQGVYPQVSSNGVGGIGVLLVMIGLATRKPNPAWIFGGVGLLALAQYRTGYVAVALLAIVWLVIRRSLNTVVLLPSVVGLFAYLSSTETFASAWERGNPTTASLSHLSGRRYWWQGAIDSAEGSPIIGNGLGSAVRFDYFEEASTVSSIHSTWVEAYVGTGTLGAVLLLLGFLLAVRSAYRTAYRRALPFPALFVTWIAVRSITGTTIEFGGVTLVLVLLVAAGMGPPTKLHGRQSSNNRIATGL